MEINNFKGQENDSLIKNQYNEFESSYDNYGDKKVVLQDSINKIEISEEYKNTKEIIEVMTDGQYYFITYNQAMKYGLMKKEEPLEKNDYECYYLTRSELDYLNIKYIVKFILVKTKKKEKTIEQNDNRGDFELEDFNYVR